MEKQSLSNFLSRRKRGDLQAVEQCLFNAGTPVARWKISDILNGKRLNEPEANLVLNALAQLIAERERTALHNIAQAQQKFEDLINN